MKKDNNTYTELAELDSDFIRVLEDLIDTLLKNGTLGPDDLPPSALEKLNRRKKARQNLQDSLHLLENKGG